MLQISLKVRNRKTREIQSVSTTELPTSIPYWFIVSGKRFSKGSWEIVEEPYLKYWMAQLIIDSMSDFSEGLAIRDIV